MNKSNVLTQAVNTHLTLSVEELSSDIFETKLPRALGKYLLIKPNRQRGIYRVMCFFFCLLVAKTHFVIPIHSS